MTRLTFWLASLLLLGCSSTTAVRDSGQPLDAALDTSVDQLTPEAGTDLPLDSANDLGVDLLADQTPCVDPGVMLANGIVVAPTTLAAGQLATVTYPPSAPLGSSSNLTLHYGFNFWSLDQGGDVAVDLPMTQLADGSFEATVSIPVGARLMDFVFFAVVGSDTQWDNNDANDYHRGVGVPLLGPYLTLRDNTATGASNDPSQGVTVSFKTDRPCTAAVHYGLNAASMTSSVTGAGAETFHHLRIDNLAADTTYHYQVSCADPAATCQVADRAPAYAFRTAPIDPSAFKFLVLSDPQDNRQPADRWVDIASALASGPHDDARFVLITGDLAGNDTPEKWWDFFDKGRPLLSSKPIMTAVGNHDTPTDNSDGDTTRFDELFDFFSSSGTDTYYAFTYGTTSFVVLNSETSQVFTSDWNPGGPQYEWANTALGKLTTPWRFVVSHIPPFNAGVRHGGQKQTRSITKLLDGKVDWVFSGHEHMYQRTKPLKYDGTSNGEVITKVVGAYGTGPTDGVGYILSPAAGHDPPEPWLMGTDAPERGLYLAHPPPEQIVDDQIVPWVGYLTVEVNGNSIAIQAWALGENTPRDQVVYTKP